MYVSSDKVFAGPFAPSFMTGYDIGYRRRTTESIFVRTVLTPRVQELHVAYRNLVGSILRSGYACSVYGAIYDDYILSLTTRRAFEHFREECDEFCSSVFDHVTETSAFDHHMTALLPSVAQLGYLHVSIDIRRAAYFETVSLYSLGNYVN